MLGQLEGVSKSNPFDTEVKYSNNLSRSFVAGIDRAIGITGYITSQIGVERLLGIEPTEEQKAKFAELLGEKGKTIDLNRKLSVYSGELIKQSRLEMDRILAETKGSQFASNVAYEFATNFSPYSMALNVVGGGLGGGISSKIIASTLVNQTKKKVISIGAGIMVNSITNGIDNILIENQVSKAVYGKKLTGQEKLNYFGSGFAGGAIFDVGGFMLGRVITKGMKFTVDELKSFKKAFDNSDVNTKAKTKNFVKDTIDRFNSGKLKRSKVDEDISIKPKETKVKDIVDEALENEILTGANVGERVFEGKKAEELINKIINEDTIDDVAEFADLVSEEIGSESGIGVGFEPHTIEDDIINTDTILEDVKIKAFADKITGRKTDYIKKATLSDEAVNFVQSYDKEILQDILIANEKTINSSKLLQDINNERADLISKKIELEEEMKQGLSIVTDKKSRKEIRKMYSDEIIKLEKDIDKNAETLNKLTEEVSSGNDFINRNVSESEEYGITEFLNEINSYQNEKDFIDTDELIKSFKDDNFVNEKPKDNFILNESKALENDKLVEQIISTDSFKEDVVSGVRSDKEMLETLVDNFDKDQEFRSYFEELKSCMLGR